MTDEKRIEENAMKQEIAGLKYNIADSLRIVYREYKKDDSDLSAEDKAILYKAMVEEMFDTLGFYGINPEEV